MMTADLCRPTNLVTRRHTSDMQDCRYGNLQQIIEQGKLAIKKSCQMCQLSYTLHCNNDTGRPTGYITLTVKLQSWSQNILDTGRLEAEKQI